MTVKCYKAKVPGSLMLFGEHAVLYGKSALVGAVDKYIIVTLIPRSDDVICIKSAVFGEYSTSLGKLKSDQFKKEDNYRFVLAAIKRNKIHLLHGFDLLIESDFSHTIGFGSSAAVTVATLAVLRCAIEGTEIRKMDLFHEAVATVQNVQKTGSGADVAASIFGGVLIYRRVPKLRLFIEKLPYSIPLSVVYSGAKTPTPIVVEQVRALRYKHEKIFENIFAAMDDCSLEAAVAIKEQDWQRLGELMNIHQGLQDALGVSNARLAELIFALRSRKEIMGAKISGAGLGDCVIGLGKVKDCNFSFSGEQIEVELTGSGLSYVEL